MKSIGAGTLTGPFLPLIFLVPVFLPWRGEILLGLFFPGDFPGIPQKF
jgi:hypothetical protein